MEVKINRWTTLGWNYRTSTENDERGNWYIPLPDKPYHMGTHKQVCEAIMQDRTYQVEKTYIYYSLAWFVKYRGKWYRIIPNDKWEYHDLAWDKQFVVDVEEVS